MTADELSSAVDWAKERLAVCKELSHDRCAYEPCKPACAIVYLSAENERLRQIIKTAIENLSGVTAKEPVFAMLNSGVGKLIK